SYTGHTFARYWMHNGLLKMGTAKMAGSVGNVVNVVDLLKQYNPETVRFLLLNTHYRSPIEWSDERLAEIDKARQKFPLFNGLYQRITGGELLLNLDVPSRRAPLDLSSAASELPVEVNRLRDKFFDHMDDDFNTGGAVGVLFELLRVLNRFAGDHRLEYREPKAPDPRLVADFKLGTRVLVELTNVLGLSEIWRSVTVA